MKFKVKQDYAELRRKDYPDIGDQLDALWKGGTALEEMARKVAAIKEKYPKPSGDKNAQG